MAALSKLIRDLRSRFPLVPRSSRDGLLRDYDELQRCQAEASGAFEDSQVFFDFAPPGHFYSPIPPIDEAVEHAVSVYESIPTDLPGIDLRVDEQLELAAELTTVHQDFDPPSDQVSDRRYFADNPAFGIGDARLLQALMRHLRPKRIVEIGSGYSSALMLDVVDEHFDDEIEITFIEPYQELLRSLLRPDDLDRVEFVSDPVQQVEPSRYEALESGDVLFVDSTHVVRVGGDVTHDVFEVLPRLRPGVVVHFHDVFYPFDYSAHWIREGRLWTEAYLLRAFLQHNDAFEIMIFPHQLQLTALDRLQEVWPTAPEGVGSLWLRRVR